MSEITPYYRTVQQLLQSQSFSIDEYQREYKWEKENIDELLSDLLDKFSNCYRPEHDTQEVGNYGEYFLGSIIVSRRKNRSCLVDGQQRVTSLTLLLIYLYRIAREQQLTALETIAPLIYSDNYGKPKFNLDIVERLPVIEALFRGQPFNPDGKDESIQTMYARYGDIEQNGFIDELQGGINHFIYWLMTRVGLIEIATGNDSYAYEIFETMNDRGKALSPVDMLKAFLLAPVENSDKRRNANQVWKQNVLNLITWGNEKEPERDINCIKAWLRAQHAESIRDRKAGASDKDWELIGNAFHRWVREHYSSLRLGSEAENVRFITEAFPFFAKAYLQILAASRTMTKGLEPIYYNAHNDFTWQNTVLLAPLQLTDDGDTIRLKLAATATYLDIWLMRRVVNYVRVGYSSVSYAMFLLCRDIRQKSTPELISILKRKLEEDDVSFEGHKLKPQRKGLSDLRLNQFSRRYIYHLLARVTAFVEEGCGRTESFDKLVDRKAKNPFDIEHILADDYSSVAADFDSEANFDEWRNHIASLLLLPADVNRSLQDKTFDKKVTHYGKQNFFAASLHADTYNHQPKFKQFREMHNLPFEAVTQFRKNDQQDRQQLLKKLVEIIWSPSRLDELV